MKIKIEDIDYHVEKAVGDLVLEAFEFRRIGEGRDPSAMLEYIQRVNDKNHVLSKELEEYKTIYNQMASAVNTLNHKLSRINDIVNE